MAADRAQASPGELVDRVVDEADGAVGHRRVDPAGCSFGTGHRTSGARREPGVAGDAGARGEVRLVALRRRAGADDLVRRRRVRRQAGGEEGAAQVPVDVRAEGPPQPVTVGQRPSVIISVFDVPSVMVRG